MKRFLIDSTKWWFLVSLFLTVVLYLTQDMSVEKAMMILGGLFLIQFLLSILIQLVILIVSIIKKK